MRLPEMMQKVDVIPIIRGHFATLTNLREGGISAKEVCFFIGPPIAAGIALVCIRFGFRIDAVNGFLNAFAILTGLLLNLLVLVFSLSATSDRADGQLRKKILKEVFTNVCYCILVAIAVVGTALTDVSYMRSTPYAVTGPISTFLLASLTLNFVLTLLMIMKRMYKLISSEFDSVSNKRAA
jgi:hypothetical protein